MHLILSIIVIVIIFISFNKWRHSYWKSKNVPQLQPDIFFGHTKHIFTQKISNAEFVTDTYKALKNLKVKHGGIYMFYKPIYFPLEPTIIKSILTKDFEHFTDHGQFYSHKDDVLTRNIFTINGSKWKDLRVKLTPTFTAGKIKALMDIVLKLSENLSRILRKYSDIAEAVDAKEIFGRFTTDVIGNCGFGIECNSIEDPNTILRKISIKIAEPRPIKMLLEELIPWHLLALFNYKSMGRDVESYFKTTVTETIKHRENNNVYRKDFMHLLIQLKNCGKVTDDGNLGKTVSGLSNFSVDDIAAQCFIFLIAGYDTASSMMTYGLYHLSRRQDIQEKVREEIKDVFGKYNGKITYEGLMEMTYTDKVIQEILRMHPPLSFIPRICTKKYKISGTNSCVIEKRTNVMIPVLGIHMDPEYYPNPEIFDPERFTPENKALQPEFTYLPFGEGPRKCIGLRFGLLQVKVGLASLIRNYMFQLNEKTPQKLTVVKSSFVTQPENKIYLNITKI